MPVSELVILRKEKTKSFLVEVLLL